MLGLGFGVPRMSRIIIEIGDTYQGGIVFYLDGSGGGLISAPSNQSTGAEWGCLGTNITGAAGTGIGTGAQNTIDIITASCSSYHTSNPTAADICSDLTLGGYSDWFMPSKDELDAMYDNLHAAGLGSFNNTVYWSSTETSSNNASGHDFNNNYQANFGTKATTYYVRAIRAF